MSHFYSAIDYCMIVTMSNNWSCDLQVSAVKESQWLFFVRHLEIGGGMVITIIEWFWIREIDDDDNQTKLVTRLDGIDSIRWILWFLLRVSYRKELTPKQKSLLECHLLLYENYNDEQRLMLQQQQLLLCFFP